jgi:hypothetical protein
MQLHWEDGSEIRAAVRGSEVCLSANREGLVSLANILLALAEGHPGDHVHLDEHNSLEDGPCDVVIELVG